MADHVYEEVEVLRDDAEGGIVAVITRRKSTGHLSYSLMKEYEKDGKLVRTSFLGRRHLEAARRLLVRVESWIDVEVDRVTAQRVAAR